MGSERLTGALLDCLTYRVHILEANGQSYRLTDAKRRLKRKWVKRTFNRRRARTGGSQLALLLLLPRCEH
jgi:hypothetical protein